MFFVSARQGTRSEVGPPAVEGGEVRAEDDLRKAVVLDAGSDDDFAPFDTGQGGGDDVLGRHAGLPAVRRR
jgi:hypothetical protein